jgi:hypothetical protein
VHRAMSVAMIVASLWFLGLTATRSSNFDFRAFYCAGAALSLHANPYHIEPLHDCEKNKTDGAFQTFARDTALPAPQPAYDLAAFAQLARFPFRIASKIWTALLVACLAATVLLVTRLCAVPLAAAVASLWLSLGIASVYVGEIVPLFILVLVAAAYCARTGRWLLAGAFGAVTLIEPHIGAPVCLSIALCAPRARAGLCATVAVLLLTSFEALKLHENVEYFRAVLPAHALSELAADSQLSLSAVAHAIGASDRIALLIGTLSSFVMAVLGIVLAARLAAKLKDAAFIVLMPAAAAVVGGSFMHVTDVVAAIPFALLLRVRTNEASRMPTVVLVLLAVPWWLLVTPMLLGPTTAIALAALTVLFLVRWSSANDLVALLAAAASAAASFAAVSLYQGSVQHVAATAAPFIPNIYPQAGWALFNARFASSGVAATWMLRAPSWIALLLLMYQAARAAALTDAMRTLRHRLARSRMGSAAPTQSSLRNA